MEAAGDEAAAGCAIQRGTVGNSLLISLNREHGKRF